MAKLDGHSVAALGPLQGEGMPPHWNCYVTVEDADASAARAAELGATLLAEPFDVFDAGRMAAFADPQGAVLSIWQAKENIGAGLVNVPGALTLERPDLTRRRGVGRVLPRALRLGDRRAGGVGRPVLVDRQRRPAQRRHDADARGAHPAWNLYFACEDADATIARAGELGGGTIMGPIDVPNGSRFAVLRDPSNAVFSVASGLMDP